MSLYKMEYILGRRPTNSIIGLPCVSHELADNLFLRLVVMRSLIILRIIQLLFQFGQPDSKVWMFDVIVEAIGISKKQAGLREFVQKYVIVEATITEVNQISASLHPLMKNITLQK